MTKTTLTVTLDLAVRKKLEARAKKELQSIEDLVAEILRRSVLSYKGSSTSDNVDDKFISFFSRKGKSKSRKRVERSSDDDFNPESLSK